MRPIRRSFAALLLTLALTIPATGPAADAGESRIGWHGEPMPEGLERAAAEGEYLWPKDGSIMVWVPAGTFVMGSEQGNYDELPVREVHLDGFYIDKYEITWRQWKASGLEWSEVSSGKKKIPEPPDWGIREGDPVLNVNWRDAQDYAAAVGKRLPTEAEWEKAARGTDGREFPWGDKWPNFEQATWVEHPTALDWIAPADCCRAGASPYGAVNMAGNAQEWVEDVYAPFFYKTAPRANPVNRESDEPIARRVVRGGAFVHEVEALRSPDRYWQYEIEEAPYIGFRLVLSGLAPAASAPVAAAADPTPSGRPE